MRTPRRSNFQMLGMSPKAHLFARPPNPHMRPRLSDIQLEVWDDEIIVSLPGTNYAVTYYKPPNSPQLLVSISLAKTMDALNQRKRSS